MNWWPFIAIGSAVGASVAAVLQTALRQSSASAVEAAAVQLKGEAEAEKLRPLLDRDEHHAAPLALLRILFSLAAVASAVQWVAGARHEGATQPLDMVIGVAGAAAVLWIGAWLVPVSIATHVGPRVVLAFAPLLKLVHVLLRPAASVYAFIDEVIRRLAGENAASNTAPESEIISALDESERDGTIDETERDMIEAVVELRDTTVEQVMTPRTEVRALEYTDELGAILQFLSESGHSRVPVFEENLDHIRGILYAKDLLNWINEHGLESKSNGDAFSLQPLLRDALFIPETKTVRELLAELLASRVHIAMIADEYGGTAGLITIEDIVEEIFGEIRDEYDVEEKDHGLRPFTADLRAQDAEARLELDEINDLLEPMNVELPESEDYDTLGGCVVVSLGRIPEAGDSLLLGRVKLTVLVAEPTRVVSVRVEVLGADDEEAVASSASEG